MLGQIGGWPSKHGRLGWYGPGPKGWAFRPGPGSGLDTEETFERPIRAHVAENTLSLLLEPRQYDGSLLRVPIIGSFWDQKTVY